jgi:thiol-disulfide isomerase/thioredoxin
MNIDPKYFNLFAVIMAVFAMMAITYFTISYAGNQRAEFDASLGSGADLYHQWFVRIDGTDSLRAVDHQDRIVIIDFWATWSQPSLESRTALKNVLSAYPDSIQPVVIAAAVRDADKTISEYLTISDASFIHVRGTESFQQLKVPGVPTQVIFAPGGKLIQSRVGFKGAEVYAVLDSLLKSKLKPVTQ